VPSKPCDKCGQPRDYPIGCPNPYLYVCGCSFTPTTTAQVAETHGLRKMAADLQAEVDRLRKFADAAQAAFHDLDYERGYLEATAALNYCGACRGPCRDESEEQRA
jgi:hypothetical protein